MPTIKNLSELDKILKPYLIKAMEMTRDEITEIIQSYIDDYYEEEFFVKNSPKNKPYSYKRTERFKNALYENIQPVKYSNGKFSFRVGFSDDYLDFVYDGGATGFEVLAWANEGAHGGIYGNSTQTFLGESTNEKYGDGDVFFWNDAMEEIRKKHGSVENLFIKNCNKIGLRLKRK